MEKKIWACPKANVNKFVANEYVAACWGVACEVMGDKQSGDDKIRPGEKLGHNKDYCGQLDHQYIRTDDAGVAIEMIEINTKKSLGVDLPCTIYNDGTYTSVRDIKTVQVGDYIYWQTSKDTRTWSHEGTVVAGSTNHS